MVGTIVTDEGWALLDFKSSISDPRGVLSAWQTEDPYPREWYGISCEKNLHISGINLHCSGLSGTISPEIRTLRRLRIVSLSENNFSGPIPPELSEIGKPCRMKCRFLETEFISFMPYTMCNFVCVCTCFA